MKKRILSISLAAAIILMAVGIAKTLPSRAEKSKVITSQSISTAVEAEYPMLGDIQQTTHATGKLRATHRYEIFAQADGQLLSSANKFKQGATYRKGQVVLAIDQQEYKMSLLAQKSEFITLATGVLPDLKTDYPEAYPLWRQYLSDLNIHHKLPQLPATDSEQLRFFLTGKGIYSNYYNIKSSEEKLDKYTIYAPFDGVVTDSKIEAGTAVRSGTELGTMISSKSFDLEVTVPLKEMAQIKIGTKAKLSSTEIDGEWSGQVIRISGDIDQASQSVKVFIRTSGASLREGMFLNAEIKGAPFKHAMSIDRKMIDNNQKIWAIKDGKLHRQQVTVLATEGPIAIVQGVDEGTALLKTVIKSAYEGMPVHIAKKS